MKPKSRRRAAGWLLAGGWASTLVIVIQGLVLVPLYVSILGDRLYGFWLASGGILAWLAMFDMGCGALTAQRCAAAYGQKNMQEVSDYLCHGVVVILGVMVMYALAVLVIGNYYLGWLDVDAVYREELLDCFYLAGFSGALSLGNNFLRGFSASMQRAAVPVFSGLIGDVSGLVFTIVALKKGMGLYAIAWAIVLRVTFSLAANTINVGWILRTIGNKVVWSRRIFRDYMKTTPLILCAKGSGSLVSQMPAIVITKMLGPEIAVVYAVTLRAAQVIQQGASSVIAALTGPINHYLNDRDIDDGRRWSLIGRITVGIAGGLGISLIVYVFSNRAFVGLWVDEAQYGGVLLTAFTGLWILISTQMRMQEVLLSATGAIRCASMLGTTERLVRAGLMIPGVWFLGMYGIPLSWAIVGAASLVAYAKFLGHEAPASRGMHRPLVIVAMIFIVGTAIGTVASAGFVSQSWLEWTLKTSAVSIVVVAATLALASEFREMCFQAVRTAAARIGWKRTEPVGEST